MRFDADALATAVSGVNPDARVYRWATSEWMLRVEVPNRLVSIDVCLLRSRADVECKFVKNRADRELLRAILDEIDRQGKR